jgi:hypothetical protein
MFGSLFCLFHATVPQQRAGRKRKMQAEAGIDLKRVSRGICRLAKSTQMEICDGKPDMSAVSESASNVGGISSVERFNRKSSYVVQK